MKSVLFLSDYENLEEFESVFSKLEAYNIKGILAKPIDITLKNSGGGLTFFLKGEELKINLLIGYSFEDDLLPAMKILNTAQACHFPVINNAETLFNGQNKEISSALLNSDNYVRHLPYFRFERFPSESNLVGIDFPAIVKPVSGACGRGLHKFDSYEEFCDWFETESPEDDSYYIQPYISKYLNRDYRVVVVNFKACYAYERKAPEGGWVTNICSTGFGTVIPLDELNKDLIEMSEVAAKAVNAPFCGVDIAYDESMKPFIIEANTCPAIKISRYIKGASTTVESAFAEFIREYLEVTDGK